MTKTYPITQAFLVVALTGCDALQPLQDDIVEARPAAVEPAEPPPPEPEAFGLPEVQLENAVRRTLLSDDIVPSDKIDVNVDLGVVALQGTVPNLLAKERAIRLASVVQGIRAVSDRLDVVTPVRSNDVIESDVRTAMLLDPAADSLDAIVRADAQRVTLSGTVDSHVEYEVAERLAKSVCGVRSVDNKLEVIRPPSRADEEIVADIEARIRWDALVDGRMVSVDVDNGAASLSGTVGTVAEKMRIVADAWAPGIWAIEDADLKVRDWASNEDVAPVSRGVPTDAQATRALELSLLFDPRVNSSTLHASVSDGTARLRGTVANLGAREAAVSAAGDVIGVRNVDAILELRKTDSSDETLQSALGQLLELSPITAEAKIEASVSKGVATLSGEVDRYAVRAEARDIAARVAGITAVNNEVEVQGSTQVFVPVRLLEPYHPVWIASGPGAYTVDPTARVVPPAILEERIEAAMIRSPFVKAGAVEIEVVDGTVRLNGTVNSIAAHDEASKAAYEAGARRIENKLQVG